MQRFKPALILACLVFSIGGCHADRGSQQPSEIASTASSSPKTPFVQPGTAPAEGAPALEPTDARPLIICFGDSLTAGYGTEAGQSYPDYLQSDLDARGYKYRVVNEGISGNTTKDGVNRLNGIVAMKPAVVIVEFGGNDGLRGLRIEDSRSNLDKIVGTLKTTRAAVVLAGITLPPDYGPDYIKQFNDTYKLLAKKYRVPMLPFLLQGVYGVDGMMQADRTHATAAGNKIVANNLMPLLLPLLKK